MLLSTHLFNCQRIYQFMFYQKNIYSFHYAAQKAALCKQIIDTQELNADLSVSPSKSCSTETEVNNDEEINLTSSQKKRHMVVHT